jgi:hypothetical protein
MGVEISILTTWVAGGCCSWSFWRVGTIFIIN